jgi:hypothetical protein
VRGDAVTLEQTHSALAAALEPLGIDVGTDVLAVWIDRRRHGRDPLPEHALRELFYVVAYLLAEHALSARPGAR